MKQFATCLLLLISLTNALAQKGGITFRTEPIDGIFATARSAGKPVFVEIYSPTCHVCQSFIPTLADSRVGKFYNGKYVSTKLDIMNKATQAWLTKKKLYVPSLPLFLYFDNKGNLMHLAMSNNSADEVIRHGTQALDPAARGTNFRQRFANGDRNGNFLIDYGMFAKVTTDTVTNIRVMEEYARQQPANQLASQTNWLVTQKLVMDMDNPLAQNLINNIGQYKAYGAQEPRNVAENILMSTLYSGRGAQFPINKIMQVRDGLVRIGIDPKVAANRTLLPEVNAHFRARQTAKAVARMDSQATNFPLSVAEYLYISRLFNKQSPDPSDVPTVTKWINKALSTNKATIQEQADLYYELAQAQHRANKDAEARKAAQKALELAKAARIDTKRNVQQLADLK
ncbi:thioredoxin family protein [Rudanella paleaurantiibacter]|uniref:Thioredoxin family protein n=1 Tax=Rudanella paleaurantiibacter TaxID=2614655 RepID=A0A7J5TV27_9BACT|nr:thioredoxin family protein [Rudanella paleaurantiibacter]KAB7727927.1 thioredoxin family protein [Rudanella paleaurantiibacter]